MTITKSLRHLVRIPIYSAPVFNIVATRHDILRAMDQARWTTQNPPSLFVDVQGYRLGRNGHVSTLNLYINDGLRHNMVWVIDITTLSKSAFEPFTNREFQKADLQFKDGRKKEFHDFMEGGLKRMLESHSVPKVFWDVRRASDALYNQFDVKLDGVREVQLMEYATRPAIGDPANIYPSLMVRPLDAMKVISTPKVPQEKKKSVAKFLGRWRVREFNGQKVGPNIEAAIKSRPLDIKSDFFKFGVTNVRLLPTIYDTYSPLLTSKHWRLVELGTKRRLENARKPDYDAWNDAGIHRNTMLPWTATEKHDYLSKEISWGEQDKNARGEGIKLRPVGNTQIINHEEGVTEQPEEKVTEAGAVTGAEAAGEMEAVEEEVTEESPSEATETVATMKDPSSELAAAGAPEERIEEVTSAQPTAETKESSPSAQAEGVELASAGAPEERIQEFTETQAAEKAPTETPEAPTTTESTTESPATEFSSAVETETETPARALAEPSATEAAAAEASVHEDQTSESKPEETTTKEAESEKEAVKEETTTEEPKEKKKEGGLKGFFGF